MQEKIFILPNRLRVVLLPYSTHSVTAILRGTAGSNYETRDYIGTAHALEHALTQTINLNPITQKGGKLTATTSREDVAYIIKILKGNYVDALVYLADILFSADFSGLNLELLKKQVSREIAHNSENPALQIGRIAYKALYPTDRLSIYNTGNLSDIQKLSLQKLTFFYKKYYTPQNFVLSICGNFNKAKVTESIYTYFDRKAKGGITQKPRHTKSKRLAVLVEKREFLPHTHLNISFYGYTSANKEKYASLYLAYILSAKLKSAAIPAYTLDSSSFSTHSYGLFGTYVALAPGDIVHFFSVYNSSLVNLTTQLVSTQIVAEIKNRIVAEHEFMIEKTSMRASFYSELLLFDNYAHSYKEEVKNYMSVSAKDVMSVAQELFAQQPKITAITDAVGESELKKLWPSASFTFY